MTRAKPVPLRAAVTDMQGLATNFENVWADVTGPEGKTNRLPMAARSMADEGQTGIYEAVDKPMMSGTYKVVLGAFKDNVDLGKDLTSFLVMAAAGERDILAAEPQSALRRSVVNRTGGTAVDLSAVDALLTDRLLCHTPEPGGGCGDDDSAVSQPWLFSVVYRVHRGGVVFAAAVAVAVKDQEDYLDVLLVACT